MILRKWATIRLLITHLTACDCCPIEQCCRCQTLASGWASDHRPILLLLALMGNARVPEHGRPPRGCSPAARRVGATGERNGSCVLAGRVTAWRCSCQIVGPHLNIWRLLRPCSPSTLPKPCWGALAARSVQPWPELPLPPAFSLQGGWNEIWARGVHLLEQQIMLQAPEGCTGV